MTDEFIGKTIGGYEVLSQIGQGGMATVYLARQNSMNRQVALKVLPLQFMKDDTYLQRFEREVKIVSQLEHRNIVPVYDYGEHDGQPYIVMRYMPAGSVDDILRRGAMPLDQINSIVSQIAPALDYAHSKEVLHRDLKPSNVLMDDGGGAFLTDFGIARIAGEQGVGITTQGVVGTPSYMSPEQAQGRDIDGRSDVYSLGVMLFEMATGRRPFEAETAYSIAVMQVTTNPPYPRSYNPEIHGAVERVILKALKKTPEERYQTATELSEALSLAIDRPDSIYDTEPNFKPAPQPQPANISAPQSPPQQQSAPMYNTSAPLIRPYSTGLRSQIGKRRRANPLLSLMIGGAIGCGILLVLTVIGFFALNMLGVFNTSRNAIPTRASSINTQSAQPTPTPDALEIAALQTLSARNIGNDATQTAIALETLNAPFPTQTGGPAPVGVREQPTLRPVFSGINGRLLFMDRRASGTETTPTYEVIWFRLGQWLETQATLDTSDNTYPIASPDGRWIAFQSNRDGDFEIYVVNLFGGQIKKITSNTYTDRLPAWSPDSEWILYSSDVRGDGTYDLYRTRLDGNETELVYTDANRKSHARYSPDGQSIIFTTGPDPNDARTWEIAVLNIATNTVTLLTDNDVRDASPVYSPDGSRILFIRFEGDVNAIYEMNADGSDQRLIHNSAGNDWAASYSPDGQFIVFTSDVSGQDELYLMTAEGTDIQQITTTGGAYASWIPDGS